MMNNFILPNNVLIVMPTFNEAESIIGMLESVLTSQPEVDVLVVDDSSPDGTSDIVYDFSLDNPRVKLMTKVEDKGFARAYISGFNYAIKNGYEYVFQMDADGSHQPKFLQGMLAASGPNKYVIGSRWIKGGSVVNWPLSRLILSKGGNLYFRIMLRMKIKDATGGFKIISTNLLKKMDINSIKNKGYSFQIELLLRAVDVGAQIEEYPIEFVEREHGVSKMSRAIILEAMTYVTLVGIKRFFSKK